MIFHTENANSILQPVISAGFYVLKMLPHEPYNSDISTHCSNWVIHMIYACLAILSTHTDACLVAH